MKKLLSIGILICLILLAGCTTKSGCYVGLFPSQADYDYCNELAHDRFMDCISDGRRQWDSEKQECYEREQITDGCITLKEYEKMESVTLPKFINNESIEECNISLDDYFYCNELNFRVHSILEDVTYGSCMRGFTIGMHSSYDYQDVHYLGKNESASEYAGMVIIPFDKEMCEPAYYVIRNSDTEVILCWGAR